MRDGVSKFQHFFHRNSLQVCSTYEKQPTATSTDVMIQLKDKYNLKISSSYIRKIRKRLGFNRVATKYAQQIRHVNQENRIM